MVLYCHIIVTCYHHQLVDHVFNVSSAFSSALSKKTLFSEIHNKRNIISKLWPTHHKSNKHPSHHPSLVKKYKINLFCRQSDTFRQQF